MARDFMASMLDELMGRDRNVEPEKRRELSFQDDDICKFYLAGFCPHDLFVNTKADLGPCKKIHDDKFKELYQKSPKFKKLGYEEEFCGFLRDLSHEMDRKIKRANERVILTNKALPSSKTEESSEDAKQELNKRINQLIAEANELGANGESDAAEAKMRELEKLKLEKRNLLELGLDIPTSSILSVERKLEVCQVCGAYLVIGDAQQRIEDHLGGKQHSGFAIVRRTLQEADEEAKRRREERSKLSPAREDDRRDKRRTNANGYSRNHRYHYDDHRRDRDHRNDRRRRYSPSPSPQEHRRRRYNDSDSDDDAKSRDRRKRNRSPRDRSRSRDRSSRRSPPSRKRTTGSRSDIDFRDSRSVSTKRATDDKNRHRRESEEDDIQDNGRKSPASSRSGGSSRKATTVREESSSHRDYRRASREES